MTSSEWRKNETRSKAARKLFDDPTLKEMLAIVRDEPPSVTEGHAVSDGDKIEQLGKDKGHRNFLAKLLSLGVHVKENGYVEPTYEPEEPESQQTRKRR